MRKLLWGFMFPALMWCVLSSFYSEGPRQGEVANRDLFIVDTIIWRDSLPNSSVSIVGQYPVAGNKLLLDSVRVWIASNLADYEIFSGDPLFTIDAAILSDGNKLAALVGRNVLDQSRDVVDEDDSTAVLFDQSYSFGPAYESDSLLTYNFSSSTLIAFRAFYNDRSKTFNRNTGVGLTYANSFIPDSLERLIDLIKDGLSTQHFKLDVVMDGEPARTLHDVLFDAENLPLPVCPPQFLADGIKFTYQEYEIASFAMGMPSCVISYEIVRPLLTPEVARLVP